MEILNVSLLIFPLFCIFLLLSSYFTRFFSSNCVLNRQQTRFTPNSNNLMCKKKSNFTTNITLSKCHRQKTKHRVIRDIKITITPCFFARLNYIFKRDSFFHLLLVVLAKYIPTNLQRKCDTFPLDELGDVNSAVLKVP